MPTDNTISNTKFYALYQTLSHQEIEDFEGVLQIPSLAGKKTIALKNLFVSLKKIISNYLKSSEELPTPKMIWEQLYPGKVFSSGMFRKNLSLLTQQLESFLAMKSLRTEDDLKNLILARELNRRNEQKNLKSLLRKFQKSFKKQEKHNPEDYLIGYYMEIEAYNLNAKEGIRGGPKSFSLLTKYLEAFCQISWLKLYAQWINQDKILNPAQQEFPEMEYITHLQNNHDRLLPASHLYLNIAKMLNETHPSSESHFSRLVEQIAFLDELLGPEDRWNIYNYALNFCIQKLNKGNESYLSHLFSLYEKALENKVLIRDEYLPVWYYKNITTLYLKLFQKEIIQKKKVVDFIETYRYKIHPDHQENLYRYCKAFLDFSLGNFVAAKKVLAHQIEHSDELIKPDAKWLLLKCYFELNDSELIEALIESFRKYLQRNKFLSAYRKRAQLTRLNLFSRIVKTPPNNKKRIQNLRRTIEDEKNLNDKGWLLDKINLIERS